MLRRELAEVQHVHRSGTKTWCTELDKHVQQEIIHCKNPQPSAAGKNAALHVLLKKMAPSTLARILDRESAVTGRSKKVDEAASELGLSRTYIGRQNAGVSFLVFLWDPPPKEVFLLVFLRNHQKHHPQKKAYPSFVGFLRETKSKTLLQFWGGPKWVPNPKLSPQRLGGPPFLAPGSRIPNNHREREEKKTLLATLNPLKADEQTPNSPQPETRKTRKNPEKPGKTRKNPQPETSERSEQSENPKTGRARARGSKVWPRSRSQSRSVSSQLPLCSKDTRASRVP